jgi:hypothetical protein
MDLPDEASEKGEAGDEFDEQYNKSEVAFSKKKLQKNSTENMILSQKKKFLLLIIIAENPCGAEPNLSMIDNLVMSSIQFVQMKILHQKIEIINTLI